MGRTFFVCLIQFLALALTSASGQTQNVGSANFGLVNVGAAAAVQTLTYNFSTATTLSAVNILTSGAPGLDYIDGGSSSCAANTAYSAGQTCTVNVAFTPSAPGLRSGGVMLFAQGINLPLMTWYLSGIGQSSAVTIDPGTQSTIATLSNSGQGYGLAIDGAGNVYVVDHANSQVIQLAAGSFTQTTVVSSGLLNPTAVALDGAGNLYISDTGNNRVVVVPNEQSGLNSGDMSTVTITGLGTPRGIAIDGSGNLYVADSTNGDVVEVPAGDGTPTPVAAGLTDPHGVAVDAAGNVYVSSNNQVAEYPEGGGSPIPYGTGFTDPRGVAVDASGEVYVMDTGNARIVIVAPGGASQATLALTGVSSPQGVAVDAAGNVYFTNSGNVYEDNRTQAVALAFGSTYVGSVSAPQTLTVSDVGNQPLIVSSLAVSTNFTQVPSGGADCSSNTQLSSAGQCLAAIEFAPIVSGALAGTFTLTDNALNNLGSTQTVQLSGGASQVAQTINFPPIPTQTYGGGTVTLNATATSGLTVTYAVISGPATVSGNVLTITGAGSVTVQASQAGNAEYAPAPPASQTFTVNPAATTIVWSNPAPITYGTPLSATQLDSTATPVSAGTYVYTPAAGTVLNAGSQTLSVQFAPSNGNYAASSGSVTLQVNQASQTITFPPIQNQTYGVGPIPLNATATSGLTVSYAVISGPATVSGSVLTITGAGSVTVQASQAGNTNYVAAAPVSQTFAVNQAPTTIVWSNPAAITYGTPLSATQLDATATPVSAGTYVYTPPAGTVLNVGSQTLSVQFTPKSSNYAPSTGSVTLQVNLFAHVVIVVQENRTPDNLFGSNPGFEPGVDIAVSGVNSQDQNVPFTPVALANCYDVGHSHLSFQQAYNGGAMNGFALEEVGPSPGCVPGPNPQFRYVDNSSGTIQPYFDLATQYGFANRMFQSNQGPSFPAHQFLISGTSAPSTDSTLFASDNPAGVSTGCASKPGTLVNMINPEGVYSTMFPCFEHGTLIDLLEGAGLTWRYYAATPQTIWTAPNAISSLCNAETVRGKPACTGSAWANVILKPAQVLTDAKKCNLADVSWVTPTGQNSDHPAGNTGGGPSWVASIVNAIGNSKCGYWKNTAILITWDDWGGWYDHVPPYRIGQSNGWGQSYVYGFRVPLLVVSPYTPAGYVDNTDHDFGSMLRFVETNFGLGLIGPGIYADSYADDLMDFFPLSSPRGFTMIPAQYDADHFIRSREKPTPPDND
jgi:phospholipase C/sugar lactone lactonase YvrE